MECAQVVVGNKAECGLRETVSIFKETFSKIHAIMHNNVCVDDCMQHIHKLMSYKTQLRWLSLELSRKGKKSTNTSNKIKCPRFGIISIVPKLHMLSL